MTTGRKLFGTDGVRGEAGTFLTAELATALGPGRDRLAGAQRPQVLIVRDTRESGPMLEAALAAGIAAAGGDALLGGVLPTPAAAILVKRLGLDLAAVVSASHNPYRDNGIKFFSAQGTKLDDERRGADRGPGRRRAAGAVEPGHVRELNGGLEDYLRALEAAFPLDLSGRRVVLDCANGATYRAAPAIFERLGAEVETIAAEPDGRNINDGCGSTHIERLAEARRRLRGRRSASPSTATATGCWPSTATGRTHDGDELIALAARGMAARGELGGGVAVTVMSNYGFHRAMEEAGIEVAVTKVGDRYVLDEMRRAGLGRSAASSPATSSTSDFVATGDGIAAALMTMRELGGRDARRRCRRWRSCRRPWSTSRSPIARRSPAPLRSGRRSSARARRSRDAAASCCAPRAPSRWCG